jgi:hypothetical protein
MIDVEMTQSSKHRIDLDLCCIPSICAQRTVREVLTTRVWNLPLRLPSDSVKSHVERFVYLRCDELSGLYVQLGDRPSKTDSRMLARFGTSP